MKWQVRVFEERMRELSGDGQRRSSFRLGSGRLQSCDTVAEASQWEGVPTSVMRDKINQSENVRELKGLGWDSLSAPPLMLPRMLRDEVIEATEPDFNLFHEPGGGKVGGKWLWEMWIPKVCFHLYSDGKVCLQGWLGASLLEVEVKFKVETYHTSKIRGIRRGA